MRRTKVYDATTQAAFDALRFLSAAANRASCSLLVACCFNFETDVPISFLFFLVIRPHPSNQLVLVHGDACGSICQLSRGQEAILQRTSSAYTRGCDISVLRVALGDNASLDSVLCNFTPETG